MREITAFLYIVFLSFVFLYKYDYGLSSSKLSHPQMFFNEKRFFKGVNKASVEGNLLSYDFLGGVVPHDSVASFYIASLFLNLQRQDVKTIIIIGPNHEEVGSYKALTSLYSWETPFGLVSVNENIISSLTKDSLVNIDNESLANEHSIGALVPYIKYYLPEVSVVPIVLKSNFTQKDSKKLGQLISEYINEKTVLIASVDFSHYLKSSEAKEKDKVTIKMIENYGVEALFKLNSDYLDSPGSVATLLNTMENTELINMEILYHANSGDLFNNELLPTTSYFVLTFR